MKPSEKLMKLWNFIYPWLFSMFFTLILTLLFNFHYEVEGFEKVLDGTITFSSIIVGFLGALLGILVSINESKIVRAIFRTKEKVTLRYYFSETFLVGILIVIFSCTMYILRENATLYTNIVFYIWLFLILLFIPSTYRIVSVLMSVFFNSNNNQIDERPKGNMISQKDRELMKNNLRKKDK